MSDVESYLAGYPVVITQVVAWGEMDAFQHVNNIVYFRYFENARIEYLNRIGWEKCLKDFRIGPIVSSVSARFKRPVTFPDTLSVGAKLKNLGDDRFVLEHIVVSHEQKTITTTGEGMIVTYNYDELQKAPVPHVMREHIVAMETAAGNTPE
ncbi:MAG: acyl-CoA thioesterase [Gemmataceae bacterium]